MKKLVVDIGDIKIAAYESDGKEQDILLIHGNSLSAKSYNKQINSSLGEKFHLIALDLPGHGDSLPANTPRKDYSVPGYSEVILAFIIQLKLSNLLIVGHSLGGHIALETSGMSPEIKGVFIFGTPPLGIPPAINEAFLDMRLIPSLIVREGFEIPQFFIDDINNTDPNARKFLMRNTAKNNLKNEIEIVSNLKIPLAIIHGAHDKLINLEYIKKIQMPSLWKNEIQIIKDAGHSPQWETPDEFNAILEEFVKEKI
ncbi:MAG: alpha/beta hydrolase [Candidatus Lokiarchaeota archaeon]|nr:alpha/beta hydrolase [Candidatus Lokiarchaeota archaeon]